MKIIDNWDIYYFRKDSGDVTHILWEQSVVQKGVKYGVTLDGYTKDLLHEGSFPTHMFNQKIKPKEHPGYKYSMDIRSLLLKITEYDDGNEVKKENIIKLIDIIPIDSNDPPPDPGRLKKYLIISKLHN